MSESESVGRVKGGKYYVEKLMNKRRWRSGRVEYLVKWWRWKSNFNTWEALETLMEDCPVLVQEYEDEEAKKRQEVRIKSEHGSPVPSTTEKEAEDKELQAEANEDEEDNANDKGEIVKDSVIVSEIPETTPKRQVPLEKGKAQMEKAKIDGETMNAVAVPSIMQEEKKETCKPRVIQPKLIPERILGITTDVKTDELQFLIKWKDMDVANLVPAKRANIGCPQLVIQFYEGRLIWREREEGVQLVQSDLDDEEEEEADGYQSDFDWEIRS